MTTTDDRVSVTIPTPAGEVGILFDGTGVIAYAGDDGVTPLPEITINGVSYHLRVHLTPRAQWERREEQWKEANPAYLSRDWVVLWDYFSRSLSRRGWGYGEATTAANRYLREKLLPVITAYLESDAAMLIEEGERRGRDELFARISEAKSEVSLLATLYQQLSYRAGRSDIPLDLLWEKYNAIANERRRGTLYVREMEKLLGEIIELGTEEKK